VKLYVRLQMLCPSYDAENDSDDIYVQPSRIEIHGFIQNYSKSNLLLTLRLKGIDLDVEQVVVVSPEVSRLSVKSCYSAF
jgi:primosomal replication protein N